MVRPFTAVLTHLRSHIVGYVAIFVVLGGTAYAVGPKKPEDTILTGRTAIPFEAGTSYGVVSGIGSSDDEVSATTLSPSIPVRAGRMAIEVLGAAAGTSYVVTLRVNGVDTEVSCVATAAEPECDSGEASTVIEAGSYMAMEVESSGEVGGGLIRYGLATGSP